MLVLVYPRNINAESDKSFSISPPNFELSANPGDKSTNTIKIQNLSDTTVLYKVKTVNFEAYGIEGQVSLTEEDSTYSIRSWIEYETQQFVIEPKQFYLLNFNINIPANAEAGSHFGAIVISNGGSDTIVNQSGATVVQEIGALILIRIPGDMNEDGKIESFKSLKEVYSEPLISFESIVENTGDVHFKLSPVINIYDIFGNKVQTFDVESKNVLPSSKRVFSSENTFEGFGYYKAVIEMPFSNGTKLLQAETTFTALYLSRSLFILILIIIIIVFYLTFKKRIKKAIKVFLKG